MPKQQIPHNPNDPNAIHEMDLDSLESDEFSPFFRPDSSTTTDDDTEIEDQETPPEGDDEDDDSQPQGDEEQYVTLASGRRITPEQIETLAQFDEFIQSNPAAWQAVQRVLSTPPVLPTPTGPEGVGTTTVPSGVPAPGYPATLPGAGSTTPPVDEIPEDIKSDPALLALYQRASKAEQEVINFRQEYQQRIIADRNAQLNAALQVASQKFQQDKNLSQEQMQQLLWHVANDKIAPAFVMANPADPVTALTSAIEVTFFRNPQFRDTYMELEEQRRKEELKKSNSRKRKASSLSGSAGSSAPPAQGPPTKAKSQQARIELLAQAMGQLRRAQE